MGSHRPSDVRWAVVGVVALALVAGLAGGYGLWTALRPDRYDPLGEYPIQTVESRVEGVAGPAVGVGEDLVVSGTKCNDADHPVTVRGNVEWVLTVPPGTTVSLPRGAGVRAPGCQVFTFSNPMPLEVVERSFELFQSTDQNPVWRISGIETPYNHAQTGAPRVFTSENFTVVVEP